MQLNSQLCNPNADFILFYYCQMRAKTTLRFPSVQLLTQFPLIPPPPVPAVLFLCSTLHPLFLFFHMWKALYPVCREREQTSQASDDFWGGRKNGAGSVAVLTCVGVIRLSFFCAQIKNLNILQVACHTVCTTPSTFDFMSKRL